MELIIRLTRIDWHPDEEETMPETYEATMEIEHIPAFQQIEGQDKGDFQVILNQNLWCQVSANTMQCWTSSDLRWKNCHE